MKKFWYLLLCLVLLVCSASVMTACSTGDDDDEEIGEMTSGPADVITIGGEGGLKFYVSTQRNGHMVSMVNVESDEVRFDIVLYNNTTTKDFGDAWIRFNIPPASFKSGSDITEDIKTMSIRLPKSDNDDTYTGGMFGNELLMKSGSVKITKITSDYAKVKFSNLVVKLGNTTLKVDGTATCEI